jgi:hypothetical protein
VDHGIVPVHSGLMAAAAEELTGHPAMRCYGAPKLTTAARGGRGGHDDSHRGRHEAAGCRGEADKEYERWRWVSFGAERLGALSSGGDDGK